jgi:hypothetical protein
MPQIHAIDAVGDYVLQSLLPNISPDALFVVPPTLLLPCIFMGTVRESPPHIIRYSRAPQNPNISYRLSKQYN